MRLIGYQATVPLNSLCHNGPHKALNKALGFSFANCCHVVTRQNNTCAIFADIYFNELLLDMKAVATRCNKSDAARPKSPATLQLSAACL